MIFDFQEFLEKLKLNPEKKEFLEKYIKQFGPITGGIKDQPWYKEYLSKFSYAPYKVPEVCKEDFDWDLFLKLVVGSFSSIYSYLPVVKEDQEEQDESKNVEYELSISVSKEDNTITKVVSELLTFQIFRLIEIYVEEQMNIWYLFNTEEKEKENIKNEMDKRVFAWKDAVKMAQMKQNLEKTKEQVIEKKEKKLDDLYSQL